MRVKTVGSRTVSGLVLSGALLLSGCGATGDETATASSGSGGTSASYDFTGETVDGAAYDGQQLAGKPAVLWFWAPWCPTCRAQAGNLMRLSEEYAGEVNVVGVGGLADATDIKDFAEVVEGPAHLVDVEGEIWRHFGVTAQSTYVVLDADGSVVTEGYLDDGVLNEQVADLVD